jgi:hypothetical protein
VLLLLLLLLLLAVYGCPSRTLHVHAQHIFASTQLPIWG